MKYTIELLEFKWNICSIDDLKLYYFHVYKVNFDIEYVSNFEVDWEYFLYRRF